MTVYIALSCLAIYCLLMSGCMQLQKMWPWESSPLQSGQRVSLAIGCPGMYGIRLLKLCSYSRFDLSAGRPVFEDVSLV